MAECNQDFEKNWLMKFSNYLERVAGNKIRDRIMAGSESFSDDSNREEVIQWSRNAIHKLDSLVDEERRIEIMTGCACQYPKSQLQDIKKIYQETKDIDTALKMLQDQFESLLKETLKLKKEIREDMVKKGWGSAGRRNVNKILATKIPKSAYIIQYFETKDLNKKRAIYCHCPRVRDTLKYSEKGLPETYCYCGAGFYKGIWEEILEKPVTVKVLKTIMKGDDVCQFELTLPLES